MAGGNKTIPSKEAFSTYDELLEILIKEKLHTKEDKLNIQNTLSNLTDIIGKALPGVEFDLLIYGSAINGLSIRGGESDLDLSMIVKSTLNEEDFNQQQRDEKKILLKVASYI